MVPTPWGDLRVNDAHVHFFSHSFFNGLAAQSGVTNAEALGDVLGWEIPSPNPALLAERWVRELDAHAVGRASLIASAPGDEGSVAEAVTAQPSRFIGYFMLDPTQPDALARVRKAGANLRCVCLFPAMHRYSLHDSSLNSIFEAVSSRGMNVFVHCGALSVGVRKKLGLPSRFDMRYSNPLDLHAIALAYPKINFVIPHFGAGMLREALMVAELCPNVSLDTSSTNRWMSYEGLDLPKVFRRCLDVVGQQRLLFGSDSSFFPRGWVVDNFTRQIAALHEVGVSAQAAADILGGNFDRLYPSAALS